MNTNIKDVYVLPDRVNDCDEMRTWSKVGVAFVNKDGSLNVILDVVPLSGRIHIRDRKKEGGKL